MSEGQSKALPPEAQAVPQPGGIGNPAEEARDRRFAELDALIATEKQAARKRRQSRKHKRKTGRKKPAAASLAEPWHRAVTRSAGGHRDKYRPDRQTAERMAKAYRAALIPRRKPGRKPDSATETAAGMRMRGDPWCEVYSAVVPGWRRMDKHERAYDGARLRRNVKGYLRRRGLKSPARISTWKK